MRYISKAAARRLCEEHSLDGAIMLAFKDDHYKIVSYGITVAFCKSLRPIVDTISEEIDAEAVPLFALSE